ncbi:MAG: glycoside hydrolase family 3 protein [Lachnospiraceae bacterium]|nr:glycoside hydrolase family 3 protein [Lachnospiraceae bacterium]
MGKGKRWFGLILSVAMLAGCMPGQAFAGGEQTDRVESLLAQMSLEEKVGQMMVPSFRIWKEIPSAGIDNMNRTVENTGTTPAAVNVTELNDEIRACIAKYHFGGTVLFAENCRDAEQVLKLTTEIQKTNLAGGGIPMLIAADQEGGTVARIGFGTSGTGNMSLAATGDPQYAHDMAAVFGEELSVLGINTDFAPVLDVNKNPNNPVIGIRSFSDDPNLVAQYGIAYMQGLHDTGTIATLKHFPGHGNTDTDSHTGFPCINESYEALKNSDLVPFQAAIDAGADMIMTAHIQYPQIEKQTYISKSSGEEVYLPATMSRTILTGILRQDMGFDGVIVTDALDMAAIADNFQMDDVICLSINAGVDMILLPIITDTDKFHETERIVESTVAMVKDGRISEEQVDASVRRILRLKERYGLLDRKDFSLSEAQITQAVTGVGNPQHRNTAYQTALKSLTLVKNENSAFPIIPKAGENVYVLFADSAASRSEAWTMAQTKLQAEGKLPDGVNVITEKNTREKAAEQVEYAIRADHAILVSRIYNSDCLDPNTNDGFSTGYFDQIIAGRHAAGKTTIVISSQLPYDAGRFTNADAILLSYCSGVMRTIPAVSGQGSAYVPNLPAALCACFSDGVPTGVLPIDLPAVDANYNLTDRILYERAQ